MFDEIRPNCGSGKHVLFQHDNYETKASKLAVEAFQTAELSLKIMKNSCIYGSKRITQTGDNVGKTEPLPLRAPERISDGKLLTDHLKVERCKC